jgi:hypothetical protein
VIGSHDAAAAPPQQPLLSQHGAGSPSPESTRRAAAPYFSRTAAVSSDSADAPTALALAASLPQQLGPQQLCSTSAAGAPVIGWLGIGFSSINFR